MATVPAGKCALITGSNTGLGFAIAQALAAAGCNIVLNGIVPEPEGSAARDALARGSGAGVIYQQADIANLAQIERLVAAAATRFGGVDILVNNAVVRHFAPVEQLTPAEWERSLAVNLSAPFHLARLVLPMMRARGFEADGMDITCNAICPGTLPTPDILGRIGKLAAAEGISEDAATQQYLAGRRPAGRFVAAESVAGLIAFLCGPGGRDITGAVLPVDGGWTAA